MPVLHNLVSNKELKARMLAETEPRTTVSFYKYFQIADPKAFRDALYLGLTALKVFGRVYVAHEGINAQISVPASQYEKMKEWLYGFDPALNNLRMNIALDDDGKSFWVLRLKVRDRIVADGIEDDSFDASDVGQYLKAADVNAMLDDLTPCSWICVTTTNMKWVASTTRWKCLLTPSAISCRWRLRCCRIRKTKRS